MPDTYARLLVNGKEAFRTTSQSGTLSPTWPDAPRGNFRIGPEDKLRVELWDKNPVNDRPIGVRDLGRFTDEMRNQRNVRVELEGGAELTFDVEPAHAVLGIGLAGLNQFDEARRHCDNAVRLRPADAEVRWYLGRILDQQGRSDEAIDALKKAIDLTPKDFRIHRAIAVAYHHRGLKGGPSAGQDLATALREFDITLRLNPGDADVLVLSGEVIEDAANAGAEVQIGASRQPATRELALARYKSAIQLNA